MNKKILIVFIITLFLDQISKAVVSSMMKLEETVVVIKNFFSITYINNYGAAWSLFTHKNVLLIILSIISLIVIYRFMYVFTKNKRNTIAFGLLFGGIMGNLIDRWLFGSVKDFLDFKIFNYDYPIFNVADIAVVLGVFLLIIAIIKGEDKIGKDKSSK